MSHEQRENLQELFRCAAARQTEVMVQNILGQGVDIHLLGLREACHDKGVQLPELFTDDSYGVSQCFLLSTSQVYDGEHCHSTTQPPNAPTMIMITAPHAPQVFPSTPPTAPAPSPQAQANLAALARETDGVRHGWQLSPHRTALRIT